MMNLGPVGFRHPYSVVFSYKLIPGERNTTTVLGSKEPRVCRICQRKLALQRCNSTALGIGRTDLVCE